MLRSKRRITGRQSRGPTASAGEQSGTDEKYPDTRNGTGNREVKEQMEFLKKNWLALLIALFLIAIGVLLMVNPTGFTTFIIKGAGVLLFALGIYDLIKYFRAEPLEGAKGSCFFSGLTQMAIGCFCFFRTDWFLSVFPVLAVIYGLFQILLGFRKLQHVVDVLRMKLPGSGPLAISAAVTLLFGFWITANPDVGFIGIWAFTGFSMILEGVLDLVVLFLQNRTGTGKKGKEQPAEPAEPAKPVQPEADAQQ